MDRIYLVALPVDASPAARNAFELVKVLMKSARDFRVTPVHIWGDWEPYTHDILFPFAPLGSDIIEFEREIENAARGYIDKWLHLSGQEKYVSKPEIYHGTCRIDLPTALRRVPYDLVALGAYGESGPTTNFIGSVTYRTLQSSMTPVLIAKPFPTPPTVRRVTVAIDLTVNSETILKQAVRLAVTTGAELDLIYVLPNPIICERNDILAGAIDFDDETVIHAAKSKINSYFDSIVRKLEVSFQYREFVAKSVASGKILSGDPADTIVKHCIENRTDLLVLGKHDPSAEGSMRIGRVAQRVLFNAPCHLYFDCSYKRKSIG